MGIRLGGISTGLNTDALVQSIMDQERRPQTLLKQRIADIQSQKSLFGELDTKLTALRDAAAAVDNRSTTYKTASASEELLDYQAKSADEQSLKATASGSAAPGTVSLQVVSLASSARRVTNAFASPTAAIASAGDTLDVSFGGKTISFVTPTGGASLADIRAAINADPSNDGSVRADIVFDGTGHRLVVRGTETGAANDVTLTTTIAGPGGGAFLDATASQSASDATLKVFGLTVTRASNTVTDLVPGLTLELTKTTTSAVDVSISLDTDAVAKKLETVANAYNDLIDFINKQSLYDEKTKKAGPLSGDSTLRMIQDNVRRVMFGDYVAGTLGGLTDLGIRFDKDKRLTVDHDALTAAVVADPNAVRALLGGFSAKQGLASELAQAIDRMKSNLVQIDPGQPGNATGTKPIFVEAGLLPTRAAADDERVKSLQAEVDRMEARLAKREELLVSQFTQMESLVTKLRGQGSSLGSFSLSSSSSTSSSTG